MTRQDEIREKDSDGIDDLCDCCREHQELVTVLTQDYQCDFDYSMNY